MTTRKHNFIQDENELRFFFDNIMPQLEDFEVYFCSLSCRKKYLSPDEREKLHITRAEMFDRKIIREKDWHRFLRTIRKYEVSEGGYLSKNGLPVPGHSLTIYFNINPSNSLKALKEFNSKINDWQFELLAGNSESYSKKFNKLDVEIMNCYQRNRGTKHWMDIDFDVPKEFNAPVLLKEFLDNKKLRYYWIDTKSGYHLLIDRKTLTFNPEDICQTGQRKLGEYYYDKFSTKNHEYSDMELHNMIIHKVYKENEIVNNRNEMIPLPGTLQGGYPVRVVKEES